MKYKKNHKQVISRLTDLFTGKGHESIYAVMNIQSRTLSEYTRKNPGYNTGYPDINDRITFWDDFLAEKSECLDDSIPSVYLSEFDEGLYTALLGGEIRFVNDPSSGWISSMSVAMLKTADDIRKIRFLTENNKWADEYAGRLNAYRSAGEGRFGISHFILIDGLNLLLELRGGTNMYLDVIDVPDDVRWLTGFARDLNLWVQKKFFEITGLIHNGTCSNLVQWIPGRILTESIDPYHMTSAQYFEEWGRENIENMFSHFDGGILHIHSNGHHLIRNASALRCLKAIALLDEDFNPVKNYMIIDKLTSESGGIPLVINIPYDVFIKSLRDHKLPYNILYNVDGVPDLSAANRVMEKVLKYKR